MIRQYLCGMAFTLAGACLFASLSGADDDYGFSAGVEVGKDVSRADGRMVRVILQKPWQKVWWEDNYWTLSGFWELSLGAWESNREPLDDDLLYDIGITPVFRLLEKGYSGSRVFLEGAIGLHFVTERDFADQDLSTNFQFGDHLGAGFVFGPDGRYALAYRFQHVSNGSISGENEGIDIQWIHATCAF